MLAAHRYRLTPKASQWWWGGGASVHRSIPTILPWQPKGPEFLVNRAHRQPIVVVVGRHGGRHRNYSVQERTLYVSSYHEMHHHRRTVLATITNPFVA